MDTVYIKMSDCPEIQELWQLKQGDRFVNPHTAGIMSGDKVLMFFPQEYDGGFTKDSQCRRDSTWLPRQEDLQTMVIHGSNLFDLLCRFQNFLELEKAPSYAAIFTSMEQLWLAFYMHVKFNKTWGRDKWVNK